MYGRVFKHILFWLIFVLLYVITKMQFASSSDLAYPPMQRFYRYFLSELAFIPWKVVPFYVLFYYLLPKYFKRGKYLEIGGFLLLSIVLCLIGYRMMVSPVTNFMYGEEPDFNVYSFKRFMYTLTDLLPALGLASTVKLLKGSIISRKKEQALQKEKLESELNFLKAQTNPHFLFNTLNNLYGLARKNAAHTADSILKLSSIMRYILYECNAREIPIEKELKVIEDYIELERLRYDDRLTVNFKKQLASPDQAIAPLILLPFIENAFKHGASESRFETFININLEMNKERLLFSVENSYDSDESGAEGIGLKNVKRQLDLIYGNFYQLLIDTKDDKFYIELSIQLKEHYENAKAELFNY